MFRLVNYSSASFSFHVEYVCNVIIVMYCFVHASYYLLSTWLFFLSSALYPPVT